MTKSTITREMHAKLNYQSSQSVHYNVRIHYFSVHYYASSLQITLNSFRHIQKLCKCLLVRIPCFPQNNNLFGKALHLLNAAQFYWGRKSHFSYFRVKEYAMFSRVSTSFTVTELENFVFKQVVQRNILRFCKVSKERAKLDLYQQMKIQ